MTWSESCTKDEMPPEWMHPHHKELERWFEQVDADRKERSGGGDDDSGMEVNALMKAR